MQTYLAFFVWVDKVSLVGKSLSVWGKKESLRECGCETAGEVIMLLHSPANSLAWGISISLTHLHGLTLQCTKKSNTLKFEFASKVKGGSLHVQTDYILTFLVGFVSFCLFGHFPVVGNYRPFEAFPGLFGAIFSTITNPCKKAPRQAAAAPVRLCWRLLASVADRLASSTQARLPWLFVFLSCLKVIQAQWLDWQTDCETIKR